MRYLFTCAQPHPITPELLSRMFKGVSAAEASALCGKISAAGIYNTAMLALNLYRNQGAVPYLAEAPAQWAMAYLESRLDTIFAVQPGERVPVTTHSTPGSTPFVPSRYHYEQLRAMSVAPGAPFAPRYRRRQDATLSLPLPKVPPFPADYPSAEVLAQEAESDEIFMAGGS